MKILIISINDIFRAPNSRINKWIEYLSRKHDITIVMLNAWYLTHNSKNRDDKYWKKVNALYFTDYKINPILQELSMLRVFFPGLFKFRVNLNDKEKYDLIINYNTLLAGLILSQKNRHVPIIFDVADDLPSIFSFSIRIPYYLRKPVKIASLLLLKINLKISNIITTITRDLALKYKFPLEKTLIIPNGVDTVFFEKECKLKHREMIRKKYKINDTDVLLGFVGIIESWVDFLPVLIAIKKLSLENRYISIKLMIIGDGPYLDKIVKISKLLELQDKVIFTGYIPYEDIPKYISAIDIGLIPFKKNEITNEIIPLKILEYFACEKPVISTKLAGIINNFNNYVLFADEPNEYYSVIKYLLNKHIREKYGRKGKEITVNKYDWLKILYKLERLYEKINEILQ